MEGLREALTRTGRRELKGTESPMQSKRDGLISIGEIAGGLGQGSRRRPWASRFGPRRAVGLLWGV